MLVNKILLRKQAGFIKLASRSFSAGHGDSHHDDQKLREVLARPVDHHGHHVELPDKDFHYMTANAKDKKYVSLFGLKPTNLAVNRLENPFKHLNDMAFTDSEQIVSAHQGSHLTHEEELTHDEPYGYIRGDDPFEPHGRADQPLIFMVLGFAMFIHFSYTHFNFTREKVSQVNLHQRITAGMLEDKIREIREEDYEVRYGKE